MGSSKSEPLALSDGEFVPRSQARIDFFDAGFVYGATVTDACRTVNGVPFRRADHVDRFLRHCRACDIELPYSADDLTRWGHRLLVHNRECLPDGLEQVLITCATPGPLFRYLGEPQPERVRPTLLMHTLPLDPERYRPLLESGAELRAAGFVPFSPGGLIDPAVKHRSRLHWWLAERRCRPGEIPLMLDGPGGNVTDTPIAAFLIVRDGAVISPPADRILESISWKVARELCDAAGIRFLERDIPASECPLADEALIAGTNFGIAGVRSIDGVNIPWPGPITRRLRAAWDRLPPD